MKPKQNQAIALLAQGVGVIETGDRIGVGKSTITRWKNDPEFQAELENLINQSAEEVKQHTLNAHKILAIATEKASTVLMELLESESEGIRLQAARLILDRVQLPEPSKEEPKTPKIISPETLRTIREQIYGF